MLCFALAMPACDTERNLDPVYNDYFVKYYGGEGMQYGVDLLVDNSDQSLILLGTSISATTPPIKRVFLVKADWNGNIIWKNDTLAGPNDVAKDIEFSNDGGYVILTETLGESAAGDESLNAKIIKVTAGGVENGSLVFGTPENEGVFANEYPSTITPVTNGYVMTGSTDYKTDLAAGDLNNISDVLYVFINNDLTIADYQEETFSNSQNEYGLKTVEVTPGRYFSFASSYKSTTTSNNNNFNFWVVPRSQTTIPDYTIGIESAGNDEIITAICPTPSPGYFLTGSHADGNNTQIYAGFVYEDGGELKKGSLEQIIEIPAYNGNQIIPVSTCQSNFGESGYLILANEGSTGFRNIWLIKAIVDNNASTNGPEMKVLWSTRFGAGERNDDTGGAVAQLPDGRIMVVGTVNLGSSNFRMALFKLNSEGKLSK